MSDSDYARMRAAMVDSQLRPSGVTRPNVVNAFRAVPREKFVPEGAAALAYLDEDIPLPGGRFLLEPMILGRLLNDLAVSAGERALIIGGATGYSAALMSEMGAKAVMVEEDGAAARHARSALSPYACDVVEAKLTEGNEAGAPYDIIFLEGRAAHVPDPIAAQLRDGGRMAGVIEDEGVPRAGIGRKAAGIVGWSFFMEAYVPALPGFERAKAFSF